MAVTYRARKYTVKGGKGAVYAPKLIRNENIRLETIAKSIALESSLTKGDVYSVIENMRDQIVRFLLLGNSVTIDGLGTFSLGLDRPYGSAVLAEDEVAVDSRKDKVKINFESASEFKSEMGGAEFVRWRPHTAHKAKNQSSD